MARGIDGVPVGRDVLVRSMPVWRGRNELRGEPQVSWWGRIGRNRTDDRSLAPSTERETEEVKEGNQARRRREGHAP